MNTKLTDMVRHLNFVVCVVFFWGASSRCHGLGQVNGAEFPNPVAAAC